MSDGNEWIEWHGGDCPVAPETEVEIFCRGMGDEFLTMEITSDGKAGHFFWKHDESFSDIIKYRIVGAAK